MKPSVSSLLVFLLFPLATFAQQGVFRCPPDRVSFEMLTGYVYTGPSDVLDSQPGTLMLTDCIDTCRQNASCQSITYETGLCVLFSSNADGNDGEVILYVPIVAITTACKIVRGAVWFPFIIRLCHTQVVGECTRNLSPLVCKQSETPP